MWYFIGQQLVINYLMQLSLSGDRVASRIRKHLTGSVVEERRESSGFSVSRRYLVGAWKTLWIVGQQSEGVAL
jgi:hypothetical protein